MQANKDLNEVQDTSNPDFFQNILLFLYHY